MAFDVSFLRSWVEPHFNRYLGTISLDRILRRSIYPCHIPSTAIRIVSFRFFLQMGPHRTQYTNHSPSDPNEQAYFWLPESDLTSTTEMLDTPVTSRMYIDRSEVVRVRVESDDFFDDEPGPPKAADGVIIPRELRRSPFQITVRLL